MKICVYIDICVLGQIDTAFPSVYVTRHN